MLSREQSDKGQMAHNWIVGGQEARKRPSLVSQVDMRKMIVLSNLQDSIHVDLQRFTHLVVVLI